MNYTDLHKPVSQDVSYGALLGLLMATAFVIVIPTLRAMQEVPLAYYYSMPVSENADFDADGVPNYMDGTPTGSRTLASVSDVDPTTEVESAAVVDAVAVEDSEV